MPKIDLAKRRRVMQRSQMLEFWGQIPQLTLLSSEPSAWGQEY